MLAYLLKSGLCLAFFLIFYNLLLEREKMHLFKRFYLLASLMLAFAIPLMTFTYYVELPIESTEISNILPTRLQPPLEALPLDGSTLSVPILLWTTYILGVLFFGFRFSKNLVVLVRRIRSNPKLKAEKSIHVLLWEKIIPHTFFNYVFLNKSKFEACEIPKEVLLHEETHARQLHSLDVVLVELLQVVFWFNPLLPWMRNAIKLNHEFLADEAVLKQGVSSPSYQKLLLAFTTSTPETYHQPAMANGINYSSISSIRLNVLGKKILLKSAYGQVKKRFTIMKKQTSKRTILLKGTLLLPLLALLLYGFTEKKVVQRDNPEQAWVAEDNHPKNVTPEMVREYNALAKKYNDNSVDNRQVKQEDIRRLEHIYHRMSSVQKRNVAPLPRFADPHQESQEGATEQQLARYNALARSYNAMIEKGEHIFVKKSDMDTLEYVYSLMTEEQKRKAEPYPVFPELPEPPEPSSPEVMEVREEIERLASLLEEQEVDIDVSHHTDEMVDVDIEIGGQQKQMRQAALALEEQDKLMQKQARALEKEARKIQEKSRLMEKEARELEREAQEMERNIPLPPLPPEPESPSEFVKKMKRKKAIFYHGNEKISADQALQLLENSNEVHIDTRGKKGKRPIVKITTEFSNQ